MIDRVFDTYSTTYPDLVEIASKLNSVSNVADIYFLNKYYKEYALKIEGEFYYEEV